MPSGYGCRRHGGIKRDNSLIPIPHMHSNSYFLCGAVECYPLWAWVYSISLYTHVSFKEFLEMEHVAVSAFFTGYENKAVYIMMPCFTLPDCFLFGLKVSQQTWCFSSVQRFSCSALSTCGTDSLDLRQVSKVILSDAYPPTQNHKSSGRVLRSAGMKYLCSELKKAAHRV